MDENEIKHCCFTVSNYFLCGDAVVIPERIGCRYFIESDSSEEQGECSFKSSKEKK